MHAKNWIVSVYQTPESPEPCATWRIEGRNEREAQKEAMHEVEREHAGKDWTLTEESVSADKPA